jgi:hypothetical protein
MKLVSLVRDDGCRCESDGVGGSACLDIPAFPVSRCSQPLRLRSKVLLACPCMLERDGEAGYALIFVDTAVLTVEQTCAAWSWRTRIFLPFAHVRAGNRLKTQMMALLCVLLESTPSNAVASRACMWALESQYRVAVARSVDAIPLCVLTPLSVVPGAVEPFLEGRCDGLLTLHRSRKPPGRQLAAASETPALGLRGN